MSDVAASPLAVVAEAGSGPLATILVGVDGSPASVRAVEWTAQLAAVAGSSVVAVHVLTFNEEFSKDAMSPDTMHTWRRDREVELKQHWLRPLADAGIAHRHRIVEADSVDAGLLACAAKSQVDVIVIGAAGSGGVLGRLVDGTSSRLTHRAKQPVVVVPRAWTADS